MNHLELTEQPVTTKRYKIFDISTLPKLWLGLRVKSKFDEQRIVIKQKYKPQHITHFKTQGQMEPVYMYGIEIKPKTQYKQLFNILNTATFCNPAYELNEQVRRYASVLKDFNLTCETCYRYLSDGIYPVDIEHLQDISNRDLSKEIESGFQMMVKKNNHEWYSSLLNFNLFVLGSTSGYQIDYPLS